MDKREHIDRPQPGTSSDAEGKPRARETEIVGANLWSPSEESDDTTARPDWRDMGLVEPSLLPSTRRLLRRFTTPGLEKPYLHFMEHRIQRNPRDLLSHVRRVMSEHARGDAEGTHGALLDLFLVLGQRGRPLRHRLLGLVSECLTEEQRRFFHNRLESGVYTSDVTAEVPRSRLSQPVAGTTNIVTLRSTVDDADADTDTVELARAAIADGRDELAQTLLEGAVEADPGDEDVCRELLTLYKRKNLRAALLRTYTASLGRRLALPEVWRRMAADFRANNIDDDRS